MEVRSRLRRETSTPNPKYGASKTLVMTPQRSPGINSPGSALKTITESDEGSPNKESYIGDLNVVESWQPHVNQFAYRLANLSMKLEPFLIKRNENEDKIES
ncbi:hypothetical protein Bhyg_07933 [Pseudolycoriella hygida]|uniref:Uncharacterized protein n=1 Tax=Pseudolycoriella hygida TaxID=35572 RepID=A0A9Q0N4F4_9DIPT|nr:hypothetical protein Bhyg_07933 [Pseudolycoriella hygida]